MLEIQVQCRIKPQVELPSDRHLYWPDLDIDLEVESILLTVRYPLAKAEYMKRAAD